MKRVLCSLSVCFLASLGAYAGIPPGVAALIKGAPNNLPQVNAAITRQIFRNARMNLKAPSSLMPRLKRSVVQVILPHVHNNQLLSDLPVQASGFLLSAYGQVWVASAYHVMGGTEQTRVIRLISNTGEEKEITVQVSVHGMSGWHEADLSLAMIKPEDIPEGMEPLEIAPPDLKAPAYSVGYTAGPYEMEDLLPVRRQFIGAEGVNLFGTYHINGASWEHPVNGNGQCGSPIVQQDPRTDKWYAVGLHNGHCLNLDAPELSKGSGVNLSIAVPYLLDSYFDPSLAIPSRSLYVRGFYVGRLGQTERVSKISLKRKGVVLWSKNIQRFTNPYSDAHAELALENEDLHSGDELIFTITRKRLQTPQRVIRSMVFLVP